MGIVTPFRAAANYLATRADWARRVGLTFGGARDMYATLGYKPVLRAEDFQERHARGGIAARIVEAYPDSTWRGEGEVYDDEAPETVTAFQQSFIDLQRKLNVWNVFHRADILCGLGAYSAILIGAPGDDLSQPLPQGLNLDSIGYLQAFPENDAQITKFDTTKGSERFGRPLEYTLKRSQRSAAGVVYQIAGTGSANPFGTDLTRPVHWSRVIHVAENLLYDNVFGQPRLMRVWNLLDDLDKVTGGGSEAFWQRVQKGLQFDLDKDIEFLPGEEEQFKEEIDKYVHGMQRYFRTRGVKVNDLGSDVTNFGPTAAALIAQIASSCEIPQRLLLGSERGELASTQDREAWAERVRDRRTQFAEQVMVRQFVERMQFCGVMPLALNDNQYKVGFGDALDYTPMEKLEMAGRASRLPTEVITKEETRDIYLGMPPLAPEQLAKIEQEKQAEQAAMAGQQLARAAVRKLITLGGPGSGNFGHEGRPGEVGGSAPGGGGSSSGGDTRSVADLIAETKAKIARGETPLAEIFNDERVPVSIRQQRLTKEERAVLTEWVGAPDETDTFTEHNTSQQINDALRNDELTPQLRERVDYLDAAISRSVTTKDATLYRGFYEGTDLKDGVTFTDKGFTSVTTQADVAGNFGEVVQVRVPRGTPLLDVAKGLGKSRDDFFDEGEHLLPRGSKFTVKTDEKGMKYVEVSAPRRKR